MEHMRESPMLTEEHSMAMMCRPHLELRKIISRIMELLYAVYKPSLPITLSNEVILADFCDVIFTVEKQVFNIKCVFR